MPGRSGGHQTGRSPGDLLVCHRVFEMSGDIPYGPLIPVKGLSGMLLGGRLEGLLDISALMTIPSAHAARAIS